MASDTTDIRCNGCGKPILNKEDGVRIALGKVSDGDFEEKKEWGVLHRSCFNKSVDDPSNVYDEMRRQAAQAKSEAVKKVRAARVR